MSLPSGRRIDSAALLEAATAVDATITARTLELWRHKGLLPHAERTGQSGTQPVWTYPAEVAEQLQALLRLRATSKDPNVLCAALWFDGYAVDTARARSAVLSYLRRMFEDIEKTFAKLRKPGDDPSEARWAAIEELARRFAGKRGKDTLRLSRQSVDDRTRAFALIFGLGLDLPEASERLQSDAPVLERAMGVDKGRHYRPYGAEPWISGPPEEGLARFREVGSLPHLISVMESATDAELDEARATTRTVLDGVALFSQIADAFAGHSNASGMAVMALLRDDPVLRVMMIAFVVSVRRTPTLSSNLDALSTALTESVLPPASRLQALAAMPTEERVAKLPRFGELPWPEQRALTRAIGIFERDAQSNGNDENDL